MFNTTDILSLGTEYTVADQKGNIIKTIQVIPHTEILDAAIGPYSPEHGTYTDYLDKCKEALTGYEDIDPNKVLWYSTPDEEVVLSEVIEYAIHNDYDKIILEHLEDTE